MKVSELIELLQERDPDAQVLIIGLRSWPFENAVERVIVRSETAYPSMGQGVPFAEADGEDVNDEQTAPEPRAMGNDVLIVEGKLLRYGWNAAWRGTTR